MSDNVIPINKDSATRIVGDDFFVEPAAMLRETADNIDGSEKCVVVLILNHNDQVEVNSSHGLPLSAWTLLRAQGFLASLPDPARTATD